MSADRIRLMTYNIRVGVETGPAALVDAVRACGIPDLLGLQEVGLRWRMGACIDQPAFLASGLDLGHRAFAGALTDDSGGQFGVALVSRWPLSAVRVLELPRDRDEQRVLLTAEVAGPIPFLAAVTHLSVHAEEREAQARVVAATLAESALPVVLLGDLNDRPGTPTLAAFAALSDAFEATGVGPDVTFSVKDPHRRIDYLRCGPPLRFVGEAKVRREATASDHFPLTGEITWQDGLAGGAGAVLGSRP
jgi:endonuclease/exonuclease/phosphatase family metal-dependent hydrolase